MRRTVILTLILLTALTAVGSASASDAGLIRQARKHKLSYMTELPQRSCQTLAGIRFCMMSFAAQVPGTVEVELRPVVAYSTPIPTAARRAYAVTYIKGKATLALRGTRFKLNGPIRTRWADGYRTLILDLALRG